MVEAKLVSITPNYMELLKLACSKPYGNNVTNKGVEAIIKSGHLSILEHCYASFEVTCSVRVLGQLTRHRHLSFTVKSARGSEFKRYCGIDDVGAKVIEEYKKLISEDEYPYEDAAYLLPQGVETTMVITGNFRAWFEYLPKRLCKRAMPEHRILAARILEELQTAAPEIFERRKFLNCDNCKERSCEFK